MERDRYNAPLAFGKKLLEKDAHTTFLNSKIYGKEFIIPTEIVVSRKLMARC